jgi:arginase
MAAVAGAGGVVWVDAHGDLNTPETSPSGNVHGMVLAAALGLGGDAFRYDEWTLPAIAPGKLALVGVR